tara:strand:- start:723 stop:1643 length:921 start_codon:yes stop_codon:yes gene_type:complete
MDYYKILDIDKNASKDTIKKAFRKLSLKYHPDKPTGDAEKFKKINEAYQTLSDDNKKRIYDMQKSGIPGMPGMPGMSGMHVNFPPGFQQFGNQEGVPDILKMFFGGIDPHQMPNTGGDPFNPFINIRTQISKPTPIQKTVVISLVSAFEGITYPVEIERTVAQNGIKKIEKETLYADIPKGIDNNEIVLLKDKGNIIGERKGDVKIHIKITNKSKFIRKGINLIMNKNITLKEALTDFKIEFDHLNGKKYKIDHTGNSIIYPNQEMRIKDMGMERNNRKGSLLIVFKIVFPQSLTDEQKEKIKKIL